MSEPEETKDPSQPLDDDSDEDDEEFRDKLKNILDSMEKGKGEFCVGCEITQSVPRCHPMITVDGLDDENNEPLAFPLTNHQAQLLRGVATKAPFGKGLDTVLDESVRKAWQIDADKVHFGQSKEWQATLKKVVSHCASKLGMSGIQMDRVNANLYKMLLYESGGFFKKHRDSEKEPGGALLIEHSGEKKQYDFLSKSQYGLFAMAFYADCEHELLPVENGWRLCLAYNLVLAPNDTVLRNLPLPTAGALLDHTKQMRKLVSTWDRQGDEPYYGYLLEHKYTETNLHFFNLKGHDKETVDFLRGCRDEEGDPLFVVCLALIEKHESGQPVCDYGGYRRHGRYRDYDDDDDDSDEDHEMEEVHETSTGVSHWIGPDDKLMTGANFRFDLESNLLADEDEDHIFEEDQSRQEYEGYTGNCGPTLDYWYYKGMVVFWPRSKNVEIMKLAGKSFLVSYLNTAPPCEMKQMGDHVIKMLEANQLKVSSSILSGLLKTDDEVLLLRALHCCKIIPDFDCAKILAKVSTQLQSDDIRKQVLEILKRTTSSNSDLLKSMKFLTSLEEKGPDSTVKEVREVIVTEAITNILGVVKSSSELQQLSKAAFKCSESTFQAFCDKVKTRTPIQSIVLKAIVSLGLEAIRHPLVIDLGCVWTNKLIDITKHGTPSFSWKMPSAKFAGSQGALVTAFLRGESKSTRFDGFNGISHARNWSNKYFGQGTVQNGYSAMGVAGGRGQDAYVTVTKTRALYDKRVSQFHSFAEELKEMKKIFGASLEVPNESLSGENEATESIEPPLPLASWAQPDAVFPGSQAELVNAFLHGEEKSQTFFNFNGLSHAENWANKYFGGYGQGTGYSARAVASQNSDGAYVTVTKTRLDSDECRPFKRLRE